MASDPKMYKQIPQLYFFFLNAMFSRALQKGTLQNNRYHISRPSFKNSGGDTMFFREQITDSSFDRHPLNEIRSDKNFIQRRRCFSQTIRTRGIINCKKKKNHKTHGINKCKKTIRTKLYHMRNTRNNETIDTTCFSHLWCRTSK